MSRYSSHSLSDVLTKSNSLNSFPPSVSALCIYLLLLHVAFVSLCEIYHVAYNLKCYSKLTIVHLCHHWFYLFCIIDDQFAIWIGFSICVINSIQLFILFISCSIAFVLIASPVSIFLYV